MSKAKEKVRHEFLAIIMIGMGSSFARGPDRDDTIRRVVSIAFSDWRTLFDLSEKEVSVNVYDVTGRTSIWWDAQGVHSSEDEALGPIPPGEVVTRTFPKAPRKRR